MKILQIIPTLNDGGAEHFTVGLINELISQGEECDLLTLYDTAQDNTLFKELLPEVNISSVHKKNGLGLKCYWDVYKYIKSRKYDVVHVHVGAIPFILLSVLLLRDVRFVATIHSEARRESGKNIMKWTRFFMFKFNKCIPVTISEASKASFDEYYKMDAKMVYNGANKYSGTGIAPLRDNDDQLLFIHPASCQLVKNQELLITAFSKLVKVCPNVKMLWLGSNKTFKPLFDTLTPKMVSQFEYVGPVPNVREYLAQADAMCLSSKMEGMPMTIIEAFSVGCPPLCTPVGGVVNMIEDGTNGLLSNSLSVDDYYQMLKKFCDMNNEDRAHMRQRAKESFAKYSIENTVSEYLKIYNSFESVVKN